MFKLFVVATFLPVMFGCSTMQKVNSNKITQHSIHAISVAGIVADYSQTLYIAKNPDLFDETNPILGEHPSVARVNYYFSGCLIAHEAIYWSLPDKYKNIYAGTVGMFQLGVVGRSIGLGVKFNFN